MRALVVVDVQNDFLPGGALAVPDGDKIVPVINTLMDHFDWVVATQDWHPEGHGSFASAHPGKKPGDIVDLNGLEQILWPDHCIQGSHGAEFSVELNSENFLEVFKKGIDKGIDSYSGFFDNGHLRATGLGDYLKKQTIQTVYISGLAADYCVKFTALDAHQLGFETYLIEDATRAVNLDPGDFNRAVAEMKTAGVKIIQSEKITS